MMKNVLHVLFLCLLTMSVQASDVQTKVLMLSGTGSDDTRTWQFLCSDGQRAGKWQPIQVPSCWEQQGFGAYTYGRFYKTKGAKPSKETGRYRMTFTMPDGWQGTAVRLVFEGVMTDATVWVNGTQAGPTHQGAFTEFSYDVSALLNYRRGAKNQLEVLVSKESVNKSVNNAERRADWWLFGGIYRPVYLESKPSVHIDDIALDARADGDLYARIRQTGEGSVRLTLDGKPVDFDAVAGCWHCAPVTLWDPEHPHLHTATFTLYNNKGEAVHSVSQRVGFRTIEFRPHDGLYLNGTKLIVKGTNRHCFHPETGRTTCKFLSLSDAELIRSMNMNAVRCHYPSDKHFLDVCDSLGLLYLEELPGWQTAYDDTTARRMLHEMMRVDVNHPCVFLWSNGNEGGWNKSVDGLFATLDPQHRHVVHPWSDFNGFDTHHYPAYQTGAYRLQNGHNVFMPTEFLHGQYDKGQGAGLDDYWNHWKASPLFAGGFLWAFVDEAVRRTDMPSGKSRGKHFGQKGFDIKDCVLDTDGTNAPDGIVGAYREPEASVYTVRNVWSPIQITSPNITPRWDGRLLIANEFLFTNLKDCRLTYSFHNYQMPSPSSPLPLPALSPGESGWLALPLPANFSDYDLLSLTAYDNQNREVYTWSFPVHRADEQRPAAADAPVVEFDEAGLLSRVTRSDGTIIPLGQGPLPVGFKAELRRWTERAEADGTRVWVGKYAGGIDSIVWRLTPDGLLHMDATLLNDERGHGYDGDFLLGTAGQKLGLTFSYPDSLCTGMTWVGRGPYRVWKNRIRGQEFGQWHKDYNNTVTGQYGTAQSVVYPEFKGYHSDLRWARLEGARGFKVYSLTEGLFLRLFTPDEPSARISNTEMGGKVEVLAVQQKKPERTMVSFPEGDISFLLEIPAMRSYKPIEQLGPGSQPSNIRIKAGDEGFHIRLVFDFSK